MSNNAEIEVKGTPDGVEIKAIPVQSGLAIAKIVLDKITDELLLQNPDGFSEAELVMNLGVVSGVAAKLISVSYGANVADVVSASSQIADQIASTIEVHKAS